MVLSLIPFFYFSHAQQVNYWKSGAMFPATTNDTIVFAAGQTKMVYWDPSQLFRGLYSIRIQGFRNEWSTWTPQTFLILESIPGGSYLLEIKNNRGNYFSIQMTVTKLENRHFSLMMILFGLVTLIIVLILLKYGANRYRAPKNKKAVTKQQEANQNSESGNPTRSRKYKKVTVLFADIQGFTKIVEHMNPEQLIDELDRFFIYFDELVERYNIEKIKTIGDAYMCAGGLPEANRTNPVDVVLAAMAMQTYVKGMQHPNRNNEFGFWELRIGIHSGSVISGMIGHKKRYFDIWGDSVNIASRMESSGIAGEINITGITYNLIKDFFVCEYRGKMPIKYKGETDMYFVKEIIPSLSVNNEGKLPNRNFQLRLQHVAFNDLLDYLYDQNMNRCISEKWFIDHLLTAETLARAERLTEEELLIIKTTVAFVFPTMINQQTQLDVIGKVPATLKRFRYVDEQITKIQQLAHLIILNEETTAIEQRVILDAFIVTLLRKNFLLSCISNGHGNASIKSSETSVQSLESALHKLINFKPLTNLSIDLVEVTPSNQIKLIKHFLKKNI